MGVTSTIEWTDATVNFWWGCTKIGPGCDHCYAETWSKRTGHRLWGTGVPRRKIKGAVALLHRLDNGYAEWAADWHVAHHNAPIFGLPEPTWGHRRRVFIQSMSDLFDTEVPIAWFDEAWTTIERCDRIEVQIVTKRISVVEKRLGAIGRATWPKHVGLMITVTNQAEADRDIPRLLDLKARLSIPWVGLSIEPMLGPIDLTRLNPGGVQTLDALSGVSRHPDYANWPTIDWVIVGGESGRDARPMHPEWARRVRNDCFSAGLPFFFKQWGEWTPTSAVDVYCHGPAKHNRKFPRAEGIAFLRDGRICLRDFSVAEHQRRIKSGIATSSRAIEVDQSALQEVRAVLNGDQRQRDDIARSYQWMYRVGKKAAGRLLDGVEHNGRPR